MPKRISKRTSDVNQAAFLMVRRTASVEPINRPAKITKSDISRVMAAMGSRGGRIGGKRRLVTMTAEKRREVAQKAAQARWAKNDENSR